jgi:circadian clock protein KaiB
VKTEKLARESTAEFEQALAESDAAHYVLRLYLTGATTRSTRAIETIKTLCEQYLPGRYELEVVDLYQQPDRANLEQIIAAPTLVKEMPLPLRRLIGDLTRPDRVLLALDLKADTE